MNAKRIQSYSQLRLKTLQQRFSVVETHEPAVRASDGYNDETAEDARFEVDLRVTLRIECDERSLCLLGDPSATTAAWARSVGAAALEQVAKFAPVQAASIHETGASVKEWDGHA
ncbi:MAG TPA: hypothetical protein VFA66_10540 [Gaiellaceae bacterium]|nr:hypothetical protein [Gaiellaceae bacterium]